MVNHSIKIYARLKKEVDKHNLASYDIVRKKEGFDDIVFSKDTPQTGVGSCGFRFHKIFDRKSSQSEVFETVAVPVINSVLEGFNGTIFAYGQTGSGKTFSITGSPKSYNERGIIPRCIQYVFRRNEKISEKPAIHMSYMEIYNEVGYDLLSPKQMNTARYLEELPRITLLEDKKGEAHIRNLSVLPVTTEKEAMRYLFLGDTNRTIAETPMNEYSSRSHCIFTIYLTHRDTGSNKMRYSKLHLVDLAGSERVSKSHSTGLALSEAKHINLSLHFLQQVILALSESRRSHIPYRNSMMTFILKDSLSGNCLTSMLATLAVSRNNILETMSTCRFAQRVSMVSTDPVINEIIDPQLEISYLKNKIEELECQLASETGFKNSSTLTDSQKSRCQYEVERYLRDNSPNQELHIVEPDLKQIQFLFGLLKSEVISRKKACEDLEVELRNSYTKTDQLKTEILKREKEIEQLKNSLEEITHLQANHNKYIRCYPPSHTMLRDHESDLATDNEPRDDMFQMFLSNPDNSANLRFYQTTLEKKLEMAKIYAQAIKQCQKNISYIKLQLEEISCFSEKSHLIRELHEQQEIYKKSLVELEEIENETQHLKSGLEQEEYKVGHHFREWLKKRKPTFSRHQNLQYFANPVEASRNQHILSQNLCFPMHQHQSFGHPVSKQYSRFDHPNVNIDGLYSFGNRNLVKANCCFSYGNRQNFGTNSCSSSEYCQGSPPNDTHYVTTFQNENRLGNNYQNLCDCSNSKALQKIDNEQAIENCCGEVNSFYSTEICDGNQINSKKIEDVTRMMSQTLPDVDRTNVLMKNAGTSNNHEASCAENVNSGSYKNFFRETDSKEYKEFMKSVTLTGDSEIDEEIFNFYRTKF